MTAQEQIAQFINESIENTDCFLIDFKVKPTHNYKIFMESDSGFTLEKAIRINRFIRRKIEESGLFPEGDFSLEVSSPGVETPLKLKRQYLKNIGRKIEVELKNEELPGIVGRLIAVNEGSIVIEPSSATKGKKSETEEKTKIEIEFEDIKQAVVCIEF